MEYAGPKTEKRDPWFGIGAAIPKAAVMEGIDATEGEIIWSILQKRWQDRGFLLFADGRLEAIGD
jgi:hypothetical protein